MVLRLARRAPAPPASSAAAAALLIVLSTPTARAFTPGARGSKSPILVARGGVGGDSGVLNGCARKRRPRTRSDGFGRTVASMVLMDPSEMIGEDRNSPPSFDEIGGRASREGTGTTTGSAEDPVTAIMREELKTLEPKDAIDSINRDASNLHSVELSTGDKGEPAAEAPATYSPPKLRQIIKFAIPAIGVWLCGPLLSLIDTAAVGLLAGTNHQAALSPAVAVTDYSALLLAFLYAATTNLVAFATASASKASSAVGGDSVTTTTTSSRDIREPEEAGGASENVGATLFSSLQLSLYVGLAIGSALFALAPALLRTLIGRATPVDPAVFDPAVLYVRIRALGFPAAAVLGSAQAACLGLKDIRSPMLVLGTAAVVNLIGDALLVGSPFSILHGAAGAAWATVLSQFAAVLLFLGLLKARPSASSPGASGPGAIMKLKGSFGSWKDACKDNSGDDSPWSVPTKLSRRGSQDPKPTLIHSKRVAMKLTALFHHRDSSAQAPGNGAEDSAVDKTKRSSPATRISARGYLYDTDFRKRHILRVPSREHWQKFVPYVVPVTTTSVGRVSLFLSMAHVVSSCMGSAGMAAQSIVLALFEALCPVADSLSLTAQTFVPEAMDAAAGEGASSYGSTGLNAITRQFLKAGSIFGGFLFLVAGCIPLVSRIFTTDAAVVAQVNAVAPYLAGAFAMHGIVMASEGVLLGRRDINFLGWMYGGYFLFVPAVMMRIKHGVISSGKAAGLQSIWMIFLGYQFSRMVFWALRAMRPIQNSDVRP